MELLDQLAADGPRLADAAARADWDAPVPDTEWRLRDLVTHVGGVHRWATEIVSTGSPGPDVASGAVVGTGPDDGDLLDWFRDGHAALVVALRAAPDDLSCFTFLPADSPRHFWLRRQAHETAIHRLDAERSAGVRTPFPADFAQDGIGEIVGGFAGRPRRRVDRDAALRLAAPDGPSWLIRFSPGRIEGSPGGDTELADATVRGTSDELYRWLWNRGPAEVEGDAAVAELWGRAVRVTWS